MKFSTAAGALVLGLSATGTAAVAAEQIHIAGSSTVLPYATIVAEAFAEANPNFKAPIVEGGGSGAGLKEFCKGVGDATIDIADASRPIKAEELDACKAAGVTEVQEIRIGYDGIVFASDIKGPDFAFVPADWFNAIGAKVLKDVALHFGEVALSPVDYAEEMWTARLCSAAAMSRFRRRAP